MTPEERLFKIIQNQENNNDAEADIQSLAPKAENSPVNESPSLAQEASAASAGASVSKYFLWANSGALFFSDLSKIFSLKTLNIILGFITAGLILFFMIDLFGFKSDPAEIFSRVKAHSMSRTIPKTENVSLAVALPDTQAVSQRNVFRPWVAPQPAQTKPAAEATVAEVGGVPARNLTDVKLVGIYMDETPEALIEFVDEKRTYVVKAGSKIKSMTVKEIKDEGVVLNDGKEEFLLQ